MKKLFLWVCIPLFLFIYLFFYSATPKSVAPTTAPQKTYALAQTPSPTLPQTGDYACILTDDTYFYLSPNGKDAVFLLPKTYYVRLISYGELYCKVEYLTTDGYLQTLTGYARTEKLTFVDYVPKRPYLTYVFDLTYRLDNAPPNGDDNFTEVTFRCAYYGDYPIGDQTWCYVLRDGEFGHVPKPNHVQYEENTEYADYLAAQTPPPSAEGDGKEKNSSPAQIATLITLCLLVPLLATLIFKSPRKPPYDNDG